MHPMNPRYDITTCRRRAGFIAKTRTGLLNRATTPNDSDRVNIRPFRHLTNPEAENVSPESYSAELVRESRS